MCMGGLGPYFDDNVSDTRRFNSLLFIDVDLHKIMKIDQYSTTLTLLFEEIKHKMDSHVYSTYIHSTLT
jgi:hypothetical protein